MLSHIIAGFLLLGFSLSLNGQSVKSLPFKNHTSGKEYSESNIRKIVYDNQGFLWIATSSGVTRYDGFGFKKLKTFSQSQTLGTGDIWDIATLKNNDSIFILNSLGQVAAYNVFTNSVSEIIPASKNLVDNWFMALAKYKSSYYFGSYKGFLYYDFESGNFKRPEQLKGYKSNKNDGYLIKVIYQDKNNNIWFIERNTGLFVFSPEKNQVLGHLSINQLTNNNNISEITANSFASFNDSVMYIATDKRLLKIKYDATYNIKSINSDVPVAMESNINAVEIHDSKLYFSTNALYEFNIISGKLSIISDASNNSIKNWTEDLTNLKCQNNSLWMCSPDRIATLDLKSPFLNSIVKSDINNPLGHVWSVFPFSYSEIFAATTKGLLSIGGNEFPITEFSNSNCILVDSIDKQNILLSTDKGLFVLNKKKSKRIGQAFPELKKYNYLEVNNIVKYDNDRILFGSENFNGIVVWDKKNKTTSEINTRNFNKPLASDIINRIYYEDGLVYVVHDKAITVIDRDLKGSKQFYFEKSQNEFMGILMDIVKCKNEYWIASYNKGIIQTDQKFQVKKIYNTINGLSDNGIYRLFVVGDSTIYCTTDNGLSVFDIRTKKFKNYYQKDGLHTNIFEERCGYYSKGLIYAGGEGGISIIDPSSITVNASPPSLFIEQVSVTSETGVSITSGLGIKKIIIPKNILQTVVSFTAINWSNPESVTFKYRIKEQGEGWVNLTTQNFITLVGLSPGTYHLQVKAANEDGVWSEYKELILIFEPKWFQTWTFYLLIALAVAGILYALYRYRIAQIKKQHEIRKNIATDLHDDLGSTLNSVKVFTNLAISGVKQEESLQQVKDNLTEATMSLRDMIWVLDDSLDTVDELITRIKQFAIPVAAASNIETIIKAHSEVNSRQLTKEEKRNLFLICKEVINNSIKYSGASQIDVDITASGKKIQIVVSDNGKGFNVDDVKKGYGLKNMQYRAGQIKYKAALQSAPGSGTQVVILPS